MPVIGTFTAAKDGYAGSIRTLMLNGRVRIVANERKSSPEAPDFRVLLDSSEIGAAWKKAKQDTGKSFLKLRLDDPAWPQPVWGVLLETPGDGLIRLVWRRTNRPDV